MARPQVTPPSLRCNEPRELLREMHAHKGVCTHCNGAVKMMRHYRSMKLMSHRCQCLFCGQRYYMEISDIDASELEQWRQKDALLA